MTCDLEHQQSNIKINKIGIQFEIFCKHLVFPSFLFPILCVCPYPHGLHMGWSKAKLFAIKLKRFSPWSRRWRAGRKASLNIWIHNHHFFHSCSYLLAQWWFTASMLNEDSHWYPQPLTSESIPTLLPLNMKITSFSPHLSWWSAPCSSDLGSGQQLLI